MAFNWADQRVIVTGGAGFLGSHVVEQLEKVGAGQVIVPRSSYFDLRKERDAANLFAYYRHTTMVIHCAANVGGIGYNRANPDALLADNVMIGLNTLEAARWAGVDKFVNIGTVCSYPKFTPVPFLEKDIWNGYPEETNAPYGLAKKLLTVQIDNYRRQYKFNAVSLIMANLYGERDNFDPESSHVIPAIIQKMVIAKRIHAPSVTLWGDGTATREFLYVRDAAEAIVLAAECYNGCEPVNIGTGFELSIADLAEIIAGIVGYPGGIQWDSSQPNGQPRRCLDVQRAYNEFGWSAKTHLFEGLRKTVRWYEHGN